VLQIHQLTKCNPKLSRFH